MKIIIETVSSAKIQAEIDISNTPVNIVQNIYKNDPTAGTQLFSSATAIEQLMNGNVDEERSSFELLTTNDDTIRAAWKEPLCNQPSIKSELAALEAEGQTPHFVVSVTSIVASRKGGNSHNR